MSRLTVVAVAIVLGFTLVHYVRRAYVPRTQTVVTDVDGSRDRRLSGKARIRARRAREVTSA